MKNAYCKIIGLCTFVFLANSSYAQIEDFMDGVLQYSKSIEERANFDIVYVKAVEYPELTEEQITQLAIGLSFQAIKDVKPDITMEALEKDEEFYSGYLEMIKLNKELIQTAEPNFYKHHIKLLPNSQMTFRISGIENGETIQVVTSEDGLYRMTDFMRTSPGSTKPFFIERDIQSNEYLEKSLCFYRWKIFLSNAKAGNLTYVFDESGNCVLENVLSDNKGTETLILTDIEGTIVPTYYESRNNTMNKKTSYSDYVNVGGTMIPSFIEKRSIPLNSAAKTFRPSKSTFVLEQ